MNRKITKEESVLSASVVIFFFLCGMGWATVWAGGILEAVHIGHFRA